MLHFGQTMSQETCFLGLPALAACVILAITKQRSGAGSGPRKKRVVKTVRGIGTDGEGGKGVERGAVEDEGGMSSFVDLLLGMLGLYVLFFFSRSNLPLDVPLYRSVSSPSAYASYLSAASSKLEFFPLDISSECRCAPFRPCQSLRRMGCTFCLLSGIDFGHATFF